MIGYKHILYIVSRLSSSTSLVSEYCRGDELLDVTALATGCTLAADNIKLVSASNACRTKSISPSSSLNGEYECIEVGQAPTRMSSFSPFNDDVGDVELVGDIRGSSCGEGDSPFELGA